MFSKQSIKKSAVSLLAFVSLFSAGAVSVSANSQTGQANVRVPAKRVHYVMPKRHHRMSRKVRRMIRIAKSKLGDRYVWGGNGPTDFDCSGFTKYLYKHGAHKNIPRLAGSQFYAGKAETEAQAKPGDLVFFGSSQNNIGHVGMYLGHDQMIDAQLRGVVTEKIHAPWWNAVGFARM